MPRKTTSKASVELQLTKEVKELSKEVKRMKSLDYMRVFANPWKFMLFALLKGIMVGLGSVLGATVVVALLVYVLAQVSFVPIIGDLVQDVIEEIGLTETIQEQLPE